MVAGGRKLRQKEKFGFDFGVDFEVESYLRYRGNQFVSRFDANSYLYITKAEDYFDLTNGTGRLNEAFRTVDTRFLVISFTSDWLYPSYQSQEIVRVLRRINGSAGILAGARLAKAGAICGGVVTVFYLLALNSDGLELAELHARLW